MCTDAAIAFFWAAAGPSTWPKPLHRHVLLLPPLLPLEATCPRGRTCILFAALFVTQGTERKVTRPPSTRVKKN